MTEPEPHNPAYGEVRTTNPVFQQDPFVIRLEALERTVSELVMELRQVLGVK